MVQSLLALSLEAVSPMTTPTATSEHYWGDGPVGLITREHAIAVARNVGRKCGYAVAVHGSQIRDLDLLAVPWTDETAYTPQMLAEDIAIALPGVVHGKWEKKPHGRVAIVIYPRVAYGFDHWYIDLSVMPRRRTRKKAP